MSMTASCFIMGSNGDQIPIDIATAPSIEDHLIHQESIRQRLAAWNVQKTTDARHQAEARATEERENAIRAKQAASIQDREEQCLCTQTHSLACPMTVYADKGALNRKVVITRATGRTPACSGCC